jgi:ferredoxin/flavodoxin---NADP+ reductase
LTADPPAEVDMIERLPTPWGLVRLGVAPDHPKLKEVSRAYERTAQLPGFRFFGNVELGRTIDHDDLMRLYDALVYAVGAQTDRRLGIPGEDLPGSWAATQFVAWYNGHPDFQDLEFDLSPERAVVIGNGNVALDVARMLVLTPQELAPTDATDAAIEAINGAGVREVVVVGRRGPVQAAWTPVELGELGDLAGADILVDAAELELDEASAAELEAAPGTVKRNMDTLRDYASREPEGKPRAIRLRFLRSPVAILGDERVEAIELVRNELVERRAVATDERERLPTGLVFRSIGYHGVPLPDLPFDESRGTLPNDGGRVLGEDGSPLRGVYCAGWIKRGPTGVIGTNKKDAVETVALLLEDAQAGRLSPREDADLLDVLAERDGRPVLYAGWEEIDRVERAAGEPHGRPRVKLATWDELLAAARSD